MKFLSITYDLLPESTVVVVMGSSTSAISLSVQGSNLLILLFAVRTDGYTIAAELVVSAPTLFCIVFLIRFDVLTYCYLGITLLTRRLGLRELTSLICLTA